MKNWKVFNFYGKRVAGRTARFFSMVLMMLTLCVGNAWGGDKISKLEEAEVKQATVGGKTITYPKPGVQYYVYAKNQGRGKTTDTENNVVFWKLTADKTDATKYTHHLVWQGNKLTNTSSAEVPADAMIVWIEDDSGTPYIVTNVGDVNGANIEKDTLFFSPQATAKFYVQHSTSTSFNTGNYLHKEPQWTFSQKAGTAGWKLSGKKYYSSAWGDVEVRAKYSDASCIDFGSSAGLETRTTQTKSPETYWRFVKVPQKFSALPTVDGDPGHGGSVQVSTDSTDWKTSIPETPLTSESKLYFKATDRSAAGYEFMGWYDAGKTDLTATAKTTDSIYTLNTVSVGAHNYVAVYRLKRPVYYRLQGIVTSGQEARGSVKVSLNGTDWYDSPNGEVVGSVVTGSNKPHITVYYKGVPSSDSYTLNSFDYINASSITGRVSKVGNSSLMYNYDPSTGITAPEFEIKNANNHLSAETACLIDLKATFGKKAEYKGAVAMTTTSPANAGTVKVAFTHDGLSDASTVTPVGSVALGDEETQAIKTIYFLATVNNTDPGRYRFNGWYSVPDTTNATQLSTLADYNKGDTVKFGKTAAENTLTLYADFEEASQKYYRTEVVAVPGNGGTVKSGFTASPTEASETSSAYSFDNSINKTAYYTAEAADGFEFQGWSTSTSSNDIIEGATSLTYSKQFAASSIDSEHPTTLKLYAIFRSVAAQEAQVLDEANEPIYLGDLSDALTCAGGVKVQLLKSVALSEALTITEPRTIDLNGFNLTGSAITVNLGSVADKWTIINSDTEGLGKISLTTSTAQAVTVEQGKLVVDGATIEVSSVETNGTTGILVNSANASLTITNGDVKVTAPENVYAVVSNAGTTTINGSAELVAHALYTNAEAYALKREGGTVVINGGGFRGSDQDIYGTMTINGGYFAHNTGLSVNEPLVISNKVPTGLKFSADDYHYMVVNRNSPNYPLCTVISKKENNPTLRYNFSTLEAAIAYANNNADDSREKTILLLENYTLPAGNYTIPHHTILSVPRSAEQTDAEPILTRINTNDIPTSAYCTLTLVDGVHIDVRGAIEVGGTQTAGNIDAAGSYGVSRPGGPTYGLMQMNSGSSITLYDESNFYAWGFVQGEGTIDVRRGATVKEQFQIMDWKGFSPTALMAVGGSIDYTLHVLPVNQYFIQNVEVKATYRPGSRLKAQVSACVQGFTLAFNDIGIIGIRYSDAEKAEDDDLKDDVAIFLMDNNDDSEDTWVRKSYDVANDVQLYEANNSAYLGSLLMDIDVSQSGIEFGGMSVQDLNVDSRDFVLPLANNFKIHLKNGTLVVTQNTVILPGAVMEIDKKATMTITDQVWRKVNGVYQWVTEPQTLYVYDKDQWGTYVFDKKPGDNYIMGYGARIRYRHGGLVKERTLTPDGLGHGKLIVHGTVDVKGYLKTTNGDKTATPVISQTDKGKDYVSGVTETTNSPSTGGASITSTIADAGTITLSRDAGYVTSGWHSSYIWQVDQISSGGTPSYFGNHAIPAWLTNEADSEYSGADGYTETAGTLAGNSFCFIDFDGDGKGEWVSLVEDGCFVKNGDDYYAKPKDYVKLLHGKTAEDDHTYKSADGTRTLILVDDCQWWEVVQVEGHPDLFECKHKDNHVFYYYDYEKSKWKEKRYTITWNTWNGEEWDTYNVKYGVKPQYLGTIPERESDAYYTYDFIGWAPEITDQTIVTADVTYTAQYERKDVMYTVTWKDMAGNTIETGYYKIGDVPTCTSEIDMTGKEWNPAVGAVTGNTIYQLQAKEVKAKYTITWKNWDGTTLQTTTPDAGTAADDVLAGYTSATPTKPALGDIEFEFAGWKPTVVDADADAVYTATFTEHPITYAITWKNGEEILLVQNVTPNTVPQYTGATPVHADDSYSFIGWSPTVVAAMDNAEYVAQFELQNKMVDGETYTIPASTQQSLTSITIADDGKLVIPATSSLTVNSLILEATSNASGQLDAPSNSNIVTVNAYFDLYLNTDARHWHAFGVPWAVDVNTDKLVEVDNDGNVVRTLNISRDYEIMYYDGAERAANGPSSACWKYLRHYDEAGQPVEVLQPGRGYMIAFGSHVNTVRFAKKSGAPIIYTGSVGVTEHQIGAISNPMAYHTTMDAGIGVGQVHDGGEIGHDEYTEVTITDKRFVVGKTVYVDPQTTQSVVVNKADGGVSPVAAPARRGVASNNKYLTLEDYYTVSLSPNNGGRAAKVYVLPEEDKADQYVAGHDLAKMGMSDRKAQIWVNRYDTKLGLNTTAPINDVAEYPINVYAPSAGEYMISLASQPNEDYTVYLMNGGRVIWNLSDAEYELALPAGVDNQYGLRLVKNAPQITTGIDEAVVDAKGETRKVLINNQVYIIRGNNVYSVDGQMVK